MKLTKKETWLAAGGGLGIGLLNGLLGSGGGLLAVPMLKKLGLDQKRAHANAVAVILPITAVSVIGYLTAGRVALQDAFIYIPGGIAGSILGTWILSKLSAPILRRIFGVFMIWAGVRLWMR